MKHLLVVLALVVCVMAWDKQKCPQPTGQFPHPIYCELYYNCWEGTEALQNCPPGLAFDADKHECTYCDEVKCAPRILKNPCSGLKTKQ